MTGDSDATTAGSGGVKSKRVIIDMGSRKKSQVRRLRKGEGALMEEVDKCLEDLRASGGIDGAVLPVIFVVKQKAKRNRLCPICMFTNNKA